MKDWLLKLFIAIWKLLGIDVFFPFGDFTNTLNSVLKLLLWTQNSEGNHFQTLFPEESYLWIRGHVDVSIPSVLSFPVHMCGVLDGTATTKRTTILYLLIWREWRGVWYFVNFFFQKKKLFQILRTIEFPVNVFNEISLTYLFGCDMNTLTLAIQGV